MEPLLPFLFSITVLFPALTRAQEKCGATLPWTTYEAEQMHTSGTVLGPGYDPYTVEIESSGQRCVRLASKDQYVEFTALAAVMH